MIAVLKRAFRGALSTYAFLAAVAMPGAFASSIDLGGLAHGESVDLDGRSGVFLIGGGTDYYDFTLAEASNVTVSLVTETFGFIVFADSNGAILGTGGSGDTFTVTDLAADSYTLKVSYKGFGLGKVGYSGTLSVAAVPLPAAALLFGTSLAGLLVARRRRNATALVPA